MTAGEPFQPARRAHVADDVFEQLAQAILGGDLAPDSVLPPERVLVERFGVSRIIARQAVHRLAEIGLVRVKQGGATVVLDPHDATDLRVLALFYKHAKAGARGPLDAADVIEKQYLQGLSLVELASRRASKSAIGALGAMVESAEHDEAVLAEFAGFEERFWRALALASENRIFRMEVAWWYEMLTERPVPPVVLATAPRARLAFYRELVRRLAADDHPVEYYLAAVRPILATVSPVRIPPPAVAPAAAVGENKKTTKKKKTGPQ